MNLLKKVFTFLKLKKLAVEFIKLNNPSKQEYEDTLRKTAEELKIGSADLIHPVRLAVSGVGGGPGVFDILSIIGKEETLSRINNAIKQINGFK